MSSWVCHDCGTINQDILDHIGTDYLAMELVQIEQKRRMEIEDKGERVKFWCSNCRAQRK